MATGYPCDIPGGFLCSPPWVPKHAMEDKLGHNSVKTFHYTTPAAYASGFFGERYYLLGGSGLRGAMRFWVVDGSM